MSKSLNFRRLLSLLLLVCCACTACHKSDDIGPTGGTSNGDENFFLSTDKAIYAPGEEIKFSLDKAAPSSAKIRYKHLNNVVLESNVDGSSWSWTAPSSDFTGYIAEVFGVENGEDKIYATIGIDVSSDWSKFPRYGFLSKFPQLTDDEIKTVMDNLNRHHINGIQFYDWHYKHHQPLAGTASNPQQVYRDIINREIYFETVKKYIDVAHQHNMKAMFYNLVFGALNDASSDGVLEGWYLFKDKAHTSKDKHPLPQPPFISDIYIVNPANTGWQQYITNEHRKVYAALPFDGYHMDQLGNRNQALYTYNGTEVDLSSTYKPFIEASKADMPNKDLVMNAVNQYGQDGIAQSPVSFLYTEVWDPNSKFADLAQIILTNNRLSNNSKKTVLAAYMNYNLADNKGLFNTPSVLLADAVIFAFGGSHLELGEHMLGKEYFPNDNLTLKEDLKKGLISYYDFMVGYQNLLRDGGEFNNPILSSVAGKIKLNNWPPATGQVSIIGKLIDNRQVIHLINFTNANSLDWRDTNGQQPYPSPIQNIALKFSSGQQVKKLWFASPDLDKGASKELDFTQTGSEVSFTIPSLQYWDMIVVEY